MDLLIDAVEGFLEFLLLDEQLDLQKSRLESAFRVGTGGVYWSQLANKMV